MQGSHHARDVYRLASAVATLTAELEAVYAFMRNGAEPSRSLLSCPVSLKVKFGSAMYLSALHQLSWILHACCVK